MPTDLSEEARRPFGPVSGLVRQHGAKLTVLHVVQDFPIAPVDAPFSPPLPAPNVEQEMKAAEGALASLVESLQGDGADLALETRVVRHHDPALAIVEFALEHAVDLIALSTHGRTGFRRLVMGSIAESVLRRSPVPVLSFHRVED